MRLFQTVPGRFLVCVFSLFLALTSHAALGQGNSNGNANGNASGKNIGWGNASDGVMGKILTSKHIYYTGDPLQIRLIFPRGADLIADGEADAVVVFFEPDTDTATVLPVSSDASEDEKVLFSLDAVDISALPAGTYQLGLILTVPGGDPLNINDWYNGLLGMIDVVGVTISDEALEADEDGDGMVDNDEDGDGFSDEDSDDDSVGDETDE
ncbi:MAG: hypothetical protein WDZ76_05995 [Pseudohongiellaceae bacterium]